MAEQNETLLLGKPYKYWLELDNQTKPLKLDRLIEEISNLRARVSFYEDRIREMNLFKEHMDRIEVSNGK